MNQFGLWIHLRRQYKSEGKEKFEQISAKYKKICEEHGAEIKAVYYITRSEAFPYLYENADFSVDTIMNSIKDGELKKAQTISETNISDKTTVTSKIGDYL